MALQSNSKLARYFRRRSESLIDRVRLTLYVGDMEQPDDRDRVGQRLTVVLVRKKGKLMIRHGANIQFDELPRKSDPVTASGNSGSGRAYMNLGVCRQFALVDRGMCSGDFTSATNADFSTLLLDSYSFPFTVAIISA